MGSGAHTSCRISKTVQDKTTVLRTSRKSRTRFRLAPTSLDDLERPIRPSRRNKIVLRSAPEKVNEDRSISLVAKCRPMILVARNIRYVRICAGGSIGEGASRTIRTAWHIYTRHMSLRPATASHTGIDCIHNQHPIILDQCPECDLLKFVQNQIRAKQWTQAWLCLCGIVGDG